MTVKITNALIQGEAGVGKTCTKRILCDQGSPSSRDSTPLADISVHVRDVTDVKVHSHNNKWKEVNDEKLQEIVGAMISGIVSEIQVKLPTETITENPADKQPVDDANETSSTLLPLELALPVDEVDETSTTLPRAELDPPDKEVTLSVDEANEPFLPPAELVSFDNESSTTCTMQPPAELDPLDKDNADETSATLLPLAELESLIDNLRDKVVDSRHPGSQNAQEILGSNWIYFIDSGGQPHFHNLLPHFLHGISIALFTLKLSEKLDSHSMVEYHENGKLISTPYRSPLTTVDTLKCLVRSMQSHTIDGKKPSLIIVGTFRDEIEKSSETVQEKNERILKILSPEFTDQLVFCEDELIFALNGKDPGAHEERMAEMIRSFVGKSPSKLTEVPIWWYILEISLKDMSNRLNRKVLSKQECLEVAKRINIKEDALVEALKFFHEQHIFHYYLNILPNVVFTSPQVLLDKLTELVKEAYDKRIKSTATTGQVIAGTWQKFRDKGIVTLEFVEYFSNHYVKGLFSPPDLLKIFTSHLILTPFSHSNSKIDFTSRTAQYFMPSLLDMLTLKQVMEYRVVPFLVSPLLIRFSNGWPRAGVFCCLQVYLIRQLNWKILLVWEKPKLIAQNCVMLSPPDSCCRVILVDSFSYIEVHVNLKNNEVCSTIRNQILKGIRASCQTLRYSEEQLQSAFFCPCTLSFPPYSADANEVPRFHAAVLLKDGNLRCTIDETITSRVKSEQTIWFRNTGICMYVTNWLFSHADAYIMYASCNNARVFMSFSFCTATVTVGSSLLQGLVEKYQLSAAQIDRKIQQEDVPYFAACFDNVEFYVDAMKLTRSERSDVLLKKNESNHLAMIKCLNIWKRNNPSQATFRELLEMLVKLKKGAIAGEVCQYLNVSVRLCPLIYVKLLLRIQWPIALPFIGVCVCFMWG